LAHLRALLYPDPNIEVGMDENAIKHALYHHRYNTFRDNLILKSNPGDIDALGALFQKGRDMDIPKFPLGGKDLLARGFEPGQHLGDTLGKLEKLWLESDFKISPEDLLTSLD
jgi:hypothetical protein